MDFVLAIPTAKFVWERTISDRVLQYNLENT